MPTPNEAPFDVIYQVDRQDLIVNVNSQWDQFANENGGLIAKSVLGRKLFDFIVGDSSRMYVDTMFQHTRLLKKGVVRQYRCDSPSMKRFMEMRIEPGSDGLLIVSHRIIKSEPVAPVVNFLYHPKAFVLRRCSVCNRLNRDGRWRELDQVLYPAMAGANLPVRYDVCGDCQTTASNA
ncbi:hypothetical protein [Planctomicrobium piriforme]|nr:hypothetical protein [Planctomicrobium piriforme]